jgi:hypothetical protein
MAILADERDAAMLERDDARDQFENYSKESFDRQLVLRSRLERYESAVCEYRTAAKVMFDHLDQSMEVEDREVLAVVEKMIENAEWILGGLNGKNKNGEEK